MSEKRVLMVATVPSMIGQFNMNNIQILQELGYIVDVAADFKDTSVWPAERVQRFKDQMEEMGIECIELDFSRSPLKLNRHYQSYKETVKLIQERKYSFIHTHTPIASAIVRQAAHKTGTKVIYTAHGFHFYDGAPLKNWLIFYPIEKHFSRYTDVLITINKEDYKRASEKFHAKKTVYIPGVGVDTEKFAVCKVDKVAKRAELGVKSDDFLLLSVGELSERMNQIVIIEALHRMKINGSIDNIVYLAVGKGDQEDEFRGLIKEYELQDHIKLLGFRTDIDELCETVDCFVHPSVREGLEIAPLEAMAAGLPLISAAVNGIKDYTEDGVSGCCIAPNDVDAMVIAIIRMKNDKTFRERCASNNFKTAKTFDIRKTNEIMFEVYRGGYSHLLSVVIRQEKREEFGWGLNDFVIISVGELNDNKNHQVIIKALQDLPLRVKYVIVGKGVLEEYLKNLSKELGVEERVILTGFRTDIRELLMSADCFAFPSKREGLGIAALEGMLTGLPIIGHDIGGIRDFVIDGDTGWLCKEDKKYVVAIKDSINAEMKYSKCVQKAMEFDVKRTNAIMKEVYKSYE